MSRWRKIAGIAAQFLVGQGALFAVNLLAELFLVRKMSIESYAQFSVAYAFQATVRILMDLGFASTIIPLVGESYSDRALVGRFVRAARHLRNRTFLLITPFASVAFLGVVHKQHWSSGAQFMLLASVLLALYSSGSISYYAAPLLLYGRLRDYYLPQTSAGGIRIIAYYCARLLNLLNASIAASLNALSLLAASILLSREARGCVDWPSKDDSETERKIVSYILPATPAIVFSAFQAQISVFLISIFGQTSSIAEVAALGRIGQIFTVMMTFNIVIVEPYVARLSRPRLPSAYLKLTLLSTALCVLLVALAFRLPAVFVWVLGEKYSELRGVIGWAIVAGSVNYIAGLMWIMNRARKWVFWSGAWMEVILVLSIQMGFLARVGVRTTRHAVLFMVSSSFCYLGAHGYVSVLGFLKEPRATPEVLSVINSTLITTEASEQLLVTEALESEAIEPARE